MPAFKYRSKGTNNEQWHEDSIEAKDQSEAIAKLDEIYGVKRNKYDEQTNTDVVQVELIK